MEVVIRFSLWSIPVTVRPSFWLVAFLLGWGAIGDGVLLASWVAIVFVSVLIHELGHALSARRYGAEVSITLTTLGGFTRWSMSDRGMSPGRRALVAGAGSAVGIVAGLSILGVFLATRPWGATAADIVVMIVWVNVGWGVLNWLPIRPLDGGHLVLALLDLVVPKHADRIASALFVVTSLGALAAALYFRLIFAAALAGFMAWAEISRYVSPQPVALPEQFDYDDEPATATPEDGPEPTR